MRIWVDIAYAPHVTSAVRRKSPAAFASSCGLIRTAACRLPPERLPTWTTARPSSGEARRARSHASTWCSPKLLRQLDAQADALAVMNLTRELLERFEVPLGGGSRREACNRSSIGFGHTAPQV